MPIITPTGQTPSQLPSSQSTAAASAKERAVAKFMAGGTNQAQEHPVANPSQVSPEDFSALVASTQKSNNEAGTSEALLPPVSPEATKPVAAPEEQPLSAQYAQLARKEKAIRAKAQEMKAKEDAFKAQDLALKAREAELQSTSSIKDRLAKDPLSVLTEMGISYEQLTQMVLNQPQGPDLQIQQLKAEIEALRQGQDSAKKTYEETQRNNYEQALNQIRTEANQLISRDPNFETIQATKSHEDVVELIRQTFEQDGVLLTVEDAAQQVEDYLVEEAMKLARINKIQQRLAPPKESKPVQQPQASDAPKQQPLKTLTNTISSSRPLSVRERAILAFKGEKRN